MVTGERNASSPNVVAREREIAAAESLLRDHRLVTIWGAAGVGKSALARAVAQRCAGGTLVVEDDVERDLDGTAKRVQAALAKDPRVHVLVTARERLRIEGERVLELTPLSCSASNAALSPAARALAHHTPLARPDLSLEHETSTLEAIAERLEGLPLALALAGARMSVMSPREVASRLGDAVPELENPFRDRTGRHQSLRAVLDDVWSGLTDDERRVMSVLAAFHGGGDADAIEHVAGDRVIATLERLREQSLVRVSTANDGTTRLSIARLWRAYAQALDARGVFEAESRHASYFAGTAARATENAYGRDAAASLAWLARERENLLAVVVGPDVSHAVTCACALTVYFVLRGLANEALPLFEAFRAHHAAHAEPFAAKVALAEASAFAELGRFEDAARLLGVSLPDHGDDAERTLLWMQIAYAQRDHARVVALGNTLLEGERRVRDDRTVGRALVQLGLECYARRDWAGAVALLGRAVDAFRAAEDARSLARTLPRIAFLLYDRGDHVAARTHLDEALAIAANLDLTAVRGIVEGYLGNLERAEGRHEAARAHYTRAMELLAAVGERRFAATFDMDLGISDLLAGEPAKAAARLSALEHTVAATGDRSLSALVYAYQALALAAAGDHVAAKAALFSAHAADPERELPLFEMIGAYLAITETPGHENVEHARNVLAAHAVHSASWEHARLIMRFVGTAVDRISPPEHALVVDGEAGCVRLPGADQTLDFSKRPTIARILFELVRRRESRLGPASVSQLARAGWPDDRMTTDSAANRVRVAISTLRSTGFEPHLVRTPEGYALAPSLEIVRSPLGQSSSAQRSV